MNFGLADVAAAALEQQVDGGEVGGDVGLLELEVERVDERADLLDHAVREPVPRRHAASTFGLSRIVVEPVGEVRRDHERRERAAAVELARRLGRACG